MNTEQFVTYRRDKGLFRGGSSTLAFLVLFALAGVAYGQAVDLVTNGGFEADPVPGYPGYAGSITGWAVVGSGILNNSSGPFYSAACGPIPEGSIVCGHQNAGSMAQGLSGLQQGQHCELYFRVNARSGYDPMQLTVSLGSHVLYGPTTITTSNPFQTVDLTFDYDTSWGSTLTFAFVNLGDDATILLDDVRFLATPMFTVTPSVAAGSGAIAPSTPQLVNQGDPITFTMTPSSGYRVSEVAIDGGRLDDPVTSYTFSDVQSDHGIAVSFALPDWPFDVDGYRDGWSVESQIQAGWTVAGSQLSYDIEETAEDPMWRSQTMALPRANYRWLRVIARNGTRSTGSILFWDDDTIGGFTGGYQHNYAINPNDTQMSEYWVDLNAKALWLAATTIDKFRFDFPDSPLPPNGLGTHVDVDRITLLPDGSGPPAPQVTSITRYDPSTAPPAYTTAAQVTWEVRFNHSMSAVAANDFDFTTTGTAAGAVYTVTRIGPTWYRVTADVSGSGSVRLDGVTGGAARDVASQAISTGYTSGEAYYVDSDGPAVDISNPSVSLTNTGPVTYTVTYTDAGSGFSASTLAEGDITLNWTGTATGTVGVAGSGNTRVVTISDIAGDGALGISIAADTATDVLGNSSPAAGPSVTFSVDNTPPTQPNVLGTTPTNNPRPTWTWTAGGGGNGTFRYDLDSSGVWTETTAMAFTPSVDLSEGPHRLVVRERDDVGNWSVDSFFDIFIDITPPTAPDVTGTTPTNNQRPTWTWTAGGGGNGTFRYDLDSSGVWAETTATDFTPPLELPEGSHRLVVQERDDVGNWSVDSFFDIFIDITPPTAPDVTGTTPTNNQRPTWTWTPGGGGNGTFRYDLDSSGVWAETTATAFTPPLELPEGSHELVVQERDDAGNWSVDSFFDIFVDITPPTAPDVTGTTPTNDQRPTWTWTPGGGGNGTFRYDLDSSGVWAETTATAFTPPLELPEGSHQLVVQERDDAGNWSVDSFFDIFVDITPPTAPDVTGTTPTNNQRPTWTWTAGGGGNGTFRYDLDSSGVWAETTATAFTPPLELPEGSHQLVVQERDDAGNWSVDSFFDVFVDITPPTVTVTSQTTADQTPTVSGTVTDNVEVAGVEVVVDGHTYVAAVVGTNWNAEVTNTVAEGTYDVAAAATDTASNTGVDVTTDELTIDLTAPVVTVDVLATNDPTPTVTGTALGQGGFAVTRVDVTIDGTLYSADISALPAWTVDVTTALGHGAYDVSAEAEDTLGRVGTDGTAGELTVDLFGPSADITLPDPNPTDLATVAFLVAFDEPVGATFDASDVSLTGTLAGAAGAPVVSGTAPDYTVTVTMNDPDDDGTLGIAIGTDVFDGVGNPHGGSASDQYTINNWVGFTAEPLDADAYVGDGVTLSVAADFGNSTPSYQWIHDDLQGKAVTNVGGDSPTLELTGLALADAGDYWCVVTYAGVDYASGKALVQVANHLAITSDPASATVDPGDSHSFTVEAAGGYTPLTYQWWKDGDVVDGATDATYAIASVEAENGGEYYAVVADASTDVRTSNTAVLTVAETALPVAGGAVLLTGLAGLILATGLAAGRRTKQ